MQEYYIIRYGNRVGPFPADRLLAEGLTPETLVWCQGMTDWQPASSVAALHSILHSQPEPEESAFGTYAEMPPTPPQGNSSTQYYAMIGDTRVGPMPASDLTAYGLKPDTPVWCKGMGDWVPASDVPEVAAQLASNRPANPYYGNGQQQYASGQYQANAQQWPDMQGPGVPAPQHYNWMTWAIIGTILGGLFSCIGLIFGVIAISKANSANNAYAMGDTVRGNSDNSTAKTMTIISLVLAGIGVIGTCVLWGTSLGSIFAGIN